ncbi:MAG: DUF5071 domain-containing protein [Gammaproteobacteria bacterium]
MGRLSKRFSGPGPSILPRDKNDVAGAERAVACGLPALQPALPELLRWLRDLRWPVAAVLIPFFGAHGEASLPHVRRALTSRNGLWKVNLLREVVARWDPALVPALKLELETLATTFDPAGADLAAIALLIRYRISEPAWIRRWLAFKRSRLQELVEESRRLEEMLSATDRH